MKLRILVSWWLPFFLGFVLRVVLPQQQALSYAPDVNTLACVALFTSANGVAAAQQFVLMHVPVQGNIVALVGTQTVHVMHAGLTLTCERSWSQAGLVIMDITAILATAFLFLRFLSRGTLHRVFAVCLVILTVLRVIVRRAADTSGVGAAPDPWLLLAGIVQVAYL